MNKLEQNDFLKMFTELCAAYDKPLNEITAITYYKFLSKYPADRIGIVINDWIEHEDYFPRISKLIVEMKYGKGQRAGTDRQLKEKPEEIPTSMPTEIKDILKNMDINQKLSDL